MSHSLWVEDRWNVYKWLPLVRYYLDILFADYGNLMGACLVLTHVHINYTKLAILAVN